jgi:hypothetical protein
MEEKKFCPKCKRELSVDSFYQVKGRNGKLTTSCYCKECLCQIGKENRAAKKEASKSVEKPKAPAPQSVPQSAPQSAAENHIHKIYYHKDLAKFQPRDLMLELKARGYEGELVHKEIIVKEHRVNLGKLN